MPIIALATTVLSALPSLIQAGVDVIALINKTSAVIAKAQANGTDPSPEDWQMLDDMLTDLRKQAQA